MSLLFQIILVAGGKQYHEYSNKGISNRTMMYKVLSNEWIELSNLPEPLEGATVVFVPPYFYLFNGADENNHLKDLVYRMKAEIGENWEFVGITKFPSKRPNVMVYNVD